MPWAKIDDNLHANEKFANVSLAATGLWTLALSWTTQQLKDGFIPAGILRRFAGADFAQIALELVEAGLWQAAEGGYIFHDYLEYNPSSEKVLAEREAAKERMTKRRSPAQEQPSVDGEANNSPRSSDVRPNFSRTSPVFAPCSPSPVPDPVPNVSSYEETSSTPKPPTGSRQVSRPQNQDDDVEKHLTPVGKLFSPTDPIPVQAEGLLTNCPDYWKDHLRLALVGREPTQVSSYACAIVREWKRGKNAPTAPLPAPDAPTLPRMSRGAEDRITRAVNMHKLHNEFEDDLYAAPITTKRAIQ